MAGRVTHLDLIAFKIRKFRLERASHEDTLWLQAVLSREGERFGTRAEIMDNGRLALRWRWRWCPDPGEGTGHLPCPGPASRTHTKSG